jgi:hypothetical protein
MMKDSGTDQPEPEVPDITIDIDKDDLWQQQRDIKRIYIRARGQANVNVKGSPVLFAKTYDAAPDLGRRPCKKRSLPRICRA